jgi:hypothetical protein
MYQRTLEDRYGWLREWLIDVEDELQFMEDGHLYQRIAYFQIAFTLYNVYLDHTTHEYVWYVAENFVLYERDLRASLRRTTLRELLITVAQTWPSI